MKAGPGLLALALGGALVGAALLSREDSDSDGNSDGGGGVVGMSRKVRIWLMLESIEQLTPTQRYFLMLVAKGEGNYSPSAHNGTPGERQASLEAANANPSIVQRALACGVPYDHLVSGSWTTFQLLAPYVAGTVFEVFGNAGCQFADPHRVVDNLQLQLALAIEHARDLQGYGGFQSRPTVGNLRLGWGIPDSMGKDTPYNAERLERYRRVALGEKFPIGIVDAPISRFPENVAQIYSDLVARWPL